MNQTKTNYDIKDNLKWLSYKCADFKFKRVCDELTCKTGNNPQNSQVYLSEDKKLLIVDRDDAMQLTDLYLEIETNGLNDAYFVAF